ncbi:MAG: hypothetical protein ABIQ93_14410, partial [Saprospiraceae bacterium]
QPVITMQDLLKVGDRVITQPCTTTTFNAGAPGANQTWNFSQLGAEGPLDTAFYTSPTVPLMRRLCDRRNGIGIGTLFSANADGRPFLADR